MRLTIGQAPLSRNNELIIRREKIPHQVTCVLVTGFTEDGLLGWKD
jgi:hypothetical protein